MPPSSETPSSEPEGPSREIDTDLTGATTAVGALGAELAVLTLRRLAITAGLAFGGLVVSFVILLIGTRATDAVGQLFGALRPALGAPLATIAIAALFFLLFSCLVLLPLRGLPWHRTALSGLRPHGGVLATVGSCLLVWPLLQLVGLVAGGSGWGGADLTWSAAAARAAGVVDPLLVNALPEEIVYRAVILGLAVQHLRTRMPDSRAVPLALVLSSLAFALGHVPIALFEERSVLAAMWFTVPGALTYGVLYLVVRNVYLVAVVHGVGNASVQDGFYLDPAATVTEPVIYVVLLLVGLLAAVPILLAQRRRPVRTPTRPATA